MGFLGGSVIKNPPANAGDAGSTPRSGRSPGEGNGNLFSIVAWEIPWTERRLAGYSQCSRKELDMTEQPNNKKSLKGHILLQKDELFTDIAPRI